MSKNVGTTKKINNPLFSASVTGLIPEDFTQNVVLLPAQEVPTKTNESSQPVQPDNPLSNEDASQLTSQKESKVEEKKEEQNVFSSFFSNTETTSTNFFITSANPFPVDPASSTTFLATTSNIQAPFHLPQQEQIPLVKHQLYPTEQVTTCHDSATSFPQPFFNTTSLTPNLSSTSLSAASSPTPSLIQSSSSPALLHDLASSSEVPTVPFYSPSQFQNNSQLLSAPEPPSGGETPGGSKNAYRRAGLKKPAYAQIPGLLSNQQQQQQFTNPPEYFLPGPPLPHLPEPTSQTLFPAVDASSSEISNTIQFSTGSNDYYTKESKTSILTPSRSPFLEESSSLQYSSPVMSAMPLEEVQQAQNSPFSTVQHESNILHANAGFNPGYREVYYHWFYKREIEGKIIWTAFSMSDSLKLEAAFTSHDISPDKVVATDGGRYDVNILRRERYPVYWNGPPTEVRRCSWFYKKVNEAHFVPYEENISTMLEAEYKTAYESRAWNKKVDLPNGDSIVLHSPDMIVFVIPNQTPDAWNNAATQSKQKLIKRGMDEFDIDEGEPDEIDHLLFLVHGVGSGCDLKFRSVEEVVEDFRSIALQLVRSHYRSSCERGLANRIEVLPISWHSHLHSEETGIDKKLKSITLESIPRLRDFTNDTLLDILFYTSPMYCQTIISTVGNELNRLYELFKQRNPTFDGGVSLGGHSLGSLILFDLLSHQYVEPEKEVVSPEDEELVAPLKPSVANRKFNRRISYMMSAAGTGQPQLIYPNLLFQPSAFFALGSPIGMFVTVRGLETLGEDFALPTCPSFFNIFHPYDPVAYRIESLINPQLASLKPVLIPHHKGRKRMHLELKETMVRVGADLKHRLLDSMKSTFSSLFQLSYFGRHENSPLLEAEVEKVIENEIKNKSNQTLYEENIEDQVSTSLPLGSLNKGRRIDYVLQEAPFEFFNEYIFALTSHVCYWESEDTMLLILKEIYGSLGFSPDSQIPQQNMTIERSPASSSSNVRQNDVEPPRGVGIDPTVPIAPQVNIGPPPITGFVKKN